MKIFRKIAAIFTAAAIAVSACASMALTAAADSIYDTAKEIKSGTKVSSFLLEKSQPSDYKIDVTKSGTLKIDYLINLRISDLIVYDSEGNIVPYNECKEIVGTNSKYHNGYITPFWNDTTEQCKLSASYDVNKGTYYIRLVTYASIEGTGKFELTATFPTATVSKAKIEYLTIKLDKGDTLSLGAALSGDSGTVTWKSSKPSVATVSSTGKITAKKAGSTIITAKCGNSSKKIKIVVN